LESDIKLANGLKLKFDDIGLFKVPVRWLNEKMGYGNNNTNKAGLIKKRLNKYHSDIICDFCIWNIGFIGDKYYAISVNRLEEGSYKLEKWKKALPSMTKGESWAYRWLTDNGWFPVKVRPTLGYGKVRACRGAPDFVCSNNRWVEVKGITSANIEISQLVYWEKLVNQGDSVFLMFSDVKKGMLSIPMDVSKSFLIAIPWVHIKKLKEANSG